MLQERRSCFNFSRFVLEQPWVGGILGYCSYSCFLLQRIIIQYYVPFLIYSLEDGSFACSDRLKGCPKGRSWFLTMPLYERFIIVMLVIAISWLVQYYFQGVLVTYCYSKILDFRANCSTCSLKIFLEFLVKETSKISSY